MTWKMIEGYRCPYRISDQGEVQRQTKDGRWVRVSAHLSRNRAYLTLRKADGIPQKVAVVRLMDTYFFGGRAKRDNMHLEGDREALGRHREAKGSCAARPERRGDDVQKYNCCGKGKRN